MDMPRRDGHEKGGKEAYFLIEEFFTKKIENINSQHSYQSRSKAETKIVKSKNGNSRNRGINHARQFVFAIGFEEERKTMAPLVATGFENGVGVIANGDFVPVESWRGLS